MGICASWKGNVDSLFSSAKIFLAALALLWILMDGGRVEVSLETEGRELILPNCSEKAGSSG